jgi:5-deoxy-glucuronate isomerase
MNLIQKARPLKIGYQTIMDPETFPLKYLKCGRIFLSDAKTHYQENTGANEVALSIFSGRCNIQVDGEPPWNDLGRRNSILSGPPTMVYVPRQRKWSILALTPALHVGVFRATARRDTSAALILPDQITIKTPGADTWKRQVTTVIGSELDADRLIVGETYALPGKWSSYPPHKHDTKKPPKEDWYEEIFHFLVEPAQGFGIQRVYTDLDDPDPFNEVYVIEDGDTVALPRGYHPVACAGGYRLAYFWALAGEDRVYAAWSDDPKHAWLRDVEPILNC